MTFANAVLAAIAALWQTIDPTAGEAALPSAPVPYSATGPAQASATPLNAALEAARSRNLSAARAYQAQLSDPIARKLVDWALIDTVAEQLAPSDLIDARTRFANWPRYNARQEAGERALARSGASPDAVLEWFGTAAPITADGAFALATALEARGRADEARNLVRTWWRDRSFDETTQERWLARYGSWLNQDDHVARLDMLLLGPQGPATRAMIPLVPFGYQQVAQARMSLRAGGEETPVPVELSSDPGLSFERARRYRARGQQTYGFAQLAQLPPAPSHTEGQDLLWSERRNYFLDALDQRNWRAAYHAMAGHGFPSGDRKVDAEFFAGWVALTKLNDPATAAGHFEALRQMSTTPITQSRALYWLGRAAEARGDRAAANQYWRAGSQYVGAFYGQLSAQRAGVPELILPPEPQPTQADVARFNDDEVVAAARLLIQSGERSLFRVFVMSIDDRLTSGEAYALLVDLARPHDQDLSMHVARAAAQRGFLLSERAYPVMPVPQVATRPDPAFVLAIIRQESAFDRRARSGANARGMMQLIPATARTVSRQMGMAYRGDESLYDPDYNMQLGSYHLGDMLEVQGGSYLLTTIAYNAGPLRATQWVPRCGDPRGAQTDPVDFIECAPFTETRNYMMRVMENMQVYRARLNGGRAPYTLSQEISRGGSPGPRPYAPGR